MISAIRIDSIFSKYTDSFVKCLRKELVYLIEKYYSSLLHVVMRIFFFFVQTFSNPILLHR